MAEVEANLCYKSGAGSNAGKLTYSKGSGQLVFKSDIAYLTVVVSWSTSDVDLDMCGYLEGLPDVKGGWSWPYCDKTYKDDKYFFRHYGDNTSAGGSEKFLIRLFPWSDMSLSHRLRIYLNYFGSSTTHVCTVTASTLSGQSISKSNIPCGIRYGNRAEPSLDPYVTIDIDENGAATSIEAHLPGSITGTVCFTAKEANSTISLISIKATLTSSGELTEQIPIFASLQISYDEISWTDWTGDIITLANVGDKVYVKAGTTNDCLAYEEYTGSNIIFEYHNFIMSGKIAASGNIMFLLDPTGNSTIIPNTVTETKLLCGFTGLFLDCTSLVQTPTLPATTLTDSCYASMFRNCTSLTKAPALPATTLADFCYNSMFESCSSLTTMPALPATTLTNYCYTGMFYNCTSLTNISTLPANALTTQCYAGMFAYCTSLTKTPILQATTLANACYMAMFADCTSLTTPPALPATTLAEECYSFMFDSCTSLNSAPILPTTTLASGCYRQLVKNDTKITHVYMPNITENVYNASLHGRLAEDHNITIHFKS